MNPFMKAFVATHVWVYRATNGKLGSSMLGGKVLLLTTKGRKTGLSRTVPVMYMDSSIGKPMICASAAGSPEHPAWFNNLVANPDITIEMPGKKLDCKAIVTTGEERAKLWAELTAKFPNFLEYTKKTTREFPMVVFQTSN